MTRHIDDSLLQDFREGLMDPEAVKEVREHLDACAQCREELEGMTELLDGLGDLPVEAQPSRDLWPQIAWRMEGATTRDLVPADAAVNGEPRRRQPGIGRRVNLPAWQLLAASIALIVISGGSVWAFLAGNMDASDPSSPVLQSQAQFAGWDEAYGGYDEAVADLEAVLERGREVLDPGTVRVLEENLHTIDRAIQDAEDALVQDPASAVLQRFLVDNLRKKMNLLRKAAGAVYATT
jgi:hypothetical protein